MTFHYGRYWAEIQPVRSNQDGAIRYWQYKIYETRSDAFLFDGHDADIDSALATTEAHIDFLMHGSQAPRAA